MLVQLELMDDSRQYLFVKSTGIQARTRDRRERFRLEDLQFQLFRNELASSTAASGLAQRGREKQLVQIFPKSARFTQQTW